MREKLKRKKPVERSTVAVEDERTSFTVRFYSELLRELAALLESIPKRHRPTRNDWIETAIEDKIKRDQKRLGINVLNNTKLQPPKTEVLQADKQLDEDNLL